MEKIGGDGDSESYTKMQHRNPYGTNEKNGLQVAQKP